MLLDLSYQQHESNHQQTPTMGDLFSRLLIPENPLPDQKRDTAEPIAIVDADQEQSRQTKEEHLTFNNAKSTSLPQKETGQSDSIKQAVNEPAAAAAPAPAAPAGPPPAGSPPSAPVPGAPPPVPAPAAPAAAPASPPKVPAPVPAPAPAPPPKGPGQPAVVSPPKMGAPSSIQTPPAPRQQERPPSEQMPNIPPGGPPPRPQPAKGQAPAHAPPPASKPSLSPGSDLGSLGRIGVFGEDSFAVHNATGVPFIHALFLCLVSIWFIMTMKRS